MLILVPQQPSASNLVSLLISPQLILNQRLIIKEILSIFLKIRDLDPLARIKPVLSWLGMKLCKTRCSKISRNQSKNLSLLLSSQQLKDLKIWICQQKPETSVNKKQKRKKSRKSLTALNKSHKTQLNKSKSAGVNLNSGTNMLTKRSKKLKNTKVNLPLLKRTRSM